VKVVVVVMVSGLQDVGPIVTALAGSVMATYIVEVGMGISTEEDRDEVVVEAVIQQEHGLESLNGYPPNYSLKCDRAATGLIVCAAEGRSRHGSSRKRIETILRVATSRYE
jgi:hypothetical protein